MNFLPDLGTEPKPPEFSDDAIALRFADYHADRLRFVAAWGKWLVYDGRRWTADNTKLGFDLARETCRQAAAEYSQTNNGKKATSIASAKTVAAVERMAEADRRLAATADQWDADPWLLNTPAGVIDLQTGHMRPHQGDDYMTKMTTTAPSGACPIWMSFLDRVTGGDADLAAYLQRTAGYALTGSTQEHALFFNYGTGANGKSVFINAIAGILGDYHKTASIETFTASSGDQHPTGIAGLRGARLVTSVETEEGRRWAEARIKTLTGGDKIEARFMRQDFFEFTPQFKLFIAGNHKPGLRSVDEAIRRRFNLIPFTVTIPEQERDPELTEKLKAEWPGILSWMCEGCRLWQQQGLCPPDSVRSATAAYLESQDAIAAWIEECCERASEAWEPRTDLFDSWQRWAKTAGEYALPRSRFFNALETRGFEPYRQSGVGTRGFRGLAIKRMDFSDAHWNR